MRASATTDATIEEVVDLLDQQGFEPSAQEWEIHMARCPRRRRPQAATPTWAPSAC
jgi:hypothetical protein